MPRTLETLDRSKPYGTVHGGRNLHRYEQNGLNFGHDGIEIPHDPDEDVVRPKPGSTAKAAPADDMVEVEVHGVKLRVAAADLPKILPGVAADLAVPEAPPAVRAAREQAAQPEPDKGDAKVPSDVSSVATMTGPEMQKLHKELTGKGFKPGTSLDDMRTALREAIAAA